MPLPHDIQRRMIFTNSLSTTSRLIASRVSASKRNFMNDFQSTNGLSSHILPVSATMVGVCVTVIGLVRLIEVNATIATIVDNIVAVDSAFFLAAALMSYISIRSPRTLARLERYADLVFLLGLVIMVVASFMLAWEFGQQPVAVLKR